MSFSRLVLYLLAAAAMASTQSMHAFDHSCWVWQRDRPLSDGEIAELAAQKITVLYWHIGELQEIGGHWRWSARFALPTGSASLRILPVVRLVTQGAQPFNEPGIAELCDVLGQEFPANTELQLDYDCPDRLLPDYAAMLGTLHPRIGRLTVTALAGWSRLPAFGALQANVDELFPMFYDLETDPLTTAASPLPLLDPALVGIQLAEWSHCRKPWQAGLPLFARVTIFDAAGHSLGHLRDWTWDDLCFNPALENTGPTHLGRTVWKVLAEGRLDRTALHPGETVAARWPDRSGLAGSMLAAEKAGARGVIFFRLPDGSDPGGWSLSQMRNFTALPQLELHLTKSGSIELTNHSFADLVPRLTGESGPLDRSYALEIDAPSAVFRDASEGDFWRVAGHIDPATRPKMVPIPLATRLTFWFSGLRAGQTVRSGNLTLAPAAQPAQIRYRILSCPGMTDWKILE